MDSRPDIQGEQALEQSAPVGLLPGETLIGHTDRSGSTLHGWTAVRSGMPFAGIGTLVLVLAVLGKVRHSEVPPWIGMLGAALFAAAGFKPMVHGLTGIVRQARAARRRAANPCEPWRWDHPWNPLGSEDDSKRRIRRALLTSILLALCLVPFNWISFFSGQRHLVAIIVTGVADLAILGMMIESVYLIARRAKSGAGMLRFRRFPFVPGQELEVMLARSGPLASLDRLEATLRCVQERYEVRRTGSRSSSQVVSYAVWSQARASEPGDGRRSTEREFTWRFLIPPNAPGTALLEPPPRYWELEVRAELPGLDYEKVFLVPVYEDQRERSARLAG